MTMAAAVYEEWVRIDESTTKVQLGMLVAKVFFRFLEVRVVSFRLLFPADGALDRKRRLRYRRSRLSNGGCAPIHCIGLGLSG